MRHGLALLVGIVALGAVAIAPAAPASAAIEVGGTVSSVNGPVLKGSVSFFPTCQDFAANMPSAVRRIDETGSYAAVLNPGSYRVLISPGRDQHAITSWHARQDSCQAATEVVIDADRVLDLEAIGTATITGAVTSAAGAVTSGSVWFYTDCVSGKEVSSAITYSRYTIELTPGTYWVRITVGAGPAVTSWHSDQTTCELATPVSVSSNATLDLRPRALYTVSGSVTSRNGAVARGSVTAYASCQDRIAGPFADTSAISQGTATLTLPPGQYWFLISTRSSHAAESWNGSQTACEDSTPITITGADPFSLTTLAVQKVKKPRTSLRVGRKTKLAIRTAQGARVTWTARPQRVCGISGHRLIARDKGRCRVTASTPATAGLVSLRANFSVAIWK